jgi:hypothetical protein
VQLEGGGHGLRQPHTSLASGSSVGGEHGRLLRSGAWGGVLAMQFKVLSSKSLGDVRWQEL